MASRFYFNNSNKSFTLIELLVVIAIIGLLSSIVLVSMIGLQGKAKITKTLEFGQSVDHALGAYAIGSWSFDEGSGTTARDGSGYGNNGAINGAVYTADTPYAAAGREGAGKYALDFNGTSDYVSIPYSSTLNTTEDITISAWVYPTAYRGSFAIIMSNAGSGSGGYVFALTNANVAFMSLVGVGFAGTNDNTVPLNAWSYVAGTWTSSTGRFRLYVNGKLGYDGSKAGTIGTNTNNHSIGSYEPTDLQRFFTGKIDEVRIYNQTLSISEIQKQYAEGLERHQNLARQ